jgi:hypothetical protein
MQGQIGISPRNSVANDAAPSTVTGGLICGKSWVSAANILHAATVPTSSGMFGCGSDQHIGAYVCGSGNSIQRLYRDQKYGRGQNANRTHQCQDVKPIGQADQNQEAAKDSQEKRKKKRLHGMPPPFKRFISMACFPPKS